MRWRGVGLTAALVVLVSGCGTGPARSTAAARGATAATSSVPGPASPAHPTPPTAPSGASPATSSGAAPVASSPATPAPAAGQASPLPPAASPSPAASLAFTSSVAKVTAADVRYTWRTGCPVGPAHLRMLRLTYVGFDAAPHTGTMVVNVKVVNDVIKIFKGLYAARVPIRRMQPVDAYKGSDPKSMADDNTSSFNCRYAVAPGPKSWSVHAYGEAIDINTVENPYLEGGTVMPAEGAAYVNRSKVRPGMAVRGGALVDAFAAAGWKWGGRWTDAPDYQHFSKTGG